MTFELRRAVPASPEQTYNALSTTRSIRQWWPEATIAVRFERPPTLIEWFVLPANTTWASSIIRFELFDGRDHACVMVIQHEGLDPPLGCFEDCRLRWEELLDRLVGFLQVTVPTTSHA